MLYRARTSLAYRYFGLKTRGIDRTPPVESRDNSPCEVHSMIGSRDVRMYLLAIKSLVSHVRNLRVVVHSDGSLTPGDVAAIGRHVRGAVFVDPAAADRRAAEVLGSRPFLAKWRGHDAAYRRLIDIELWRARDRVMILDADVLTVGAPSDVADWVERGTHPFLLGQPPARAHEPAATTGSHVQAQFLHRVPELSARLGVAPSFLQGTTAGFCGFQQQLALDRVETALRAAIDIGLPMEQWGGDQCLVIFLLSVGGGERLPAGEYVNFEPRLAERAATAKVIHFFGTHRFYGLVYPRLAAAATRRLLNAQ